MNVIYSRIVWSIRTIGSHVLQMLPCMLVGLLIWLLVWPWRKKRLTRRGQYSSPLREGALLAFVLFCVGLAAMTVFPYGIWSAVFEAVLCPGKELDLWDFYLPPEQILLRMEEFCQRVVPFREIRRVLLWGDRWLWFILWGNIIMFMPVGFCSGLLWFNGTWKRATGVGFFFSFSIEVIQLFIGRITDIDDVILNTLGALLGYILYRLFRWVWPELAQKFHIQKREDKVHGGLEAN